jgi:hypothetical protein
MSSSGYRFDDDLARRFPLPLARLYRRAHNEKKPLDRHLMALNLWEVALKMLGSTAAVVYTERGQPTPEASAALERLARPTLGDWWSLVRVLVELLADSGDAGFSAARKLILGPARNDLPRTAALDAAMREALGDAPGTRGNGNVRLFELFDQRLVNYRNRVFGHGAPAQRRAEFHDRMARALLDGAAEVLERLDVLAGRRLVYVSEVQRQPSGRWAIERDELIGEAHRRLDTIEHEGKDTSLLPTPKRVYLESGPVEAPEFPPIALHPLLIYDPDINEALFLNARKGKKRALYLCYNTGEERELPDLGLEPRALLTRVLGMEDKSEPADDPGQGPRIEPGRAESPTSRSRIPESFRRRGAPIALVLALIALPLTLTSKPSWFSPKSLTGTGPGAVPKRANLPAPTPVPVPEADRNQALLVGCTRYPNLESPWLEGPGNDVVLMRTLLVENFHFPDPAIVTLAEGGDSDHRPTRGNIERAFQRLAERAVPGQQVVILLSGLGSQQPDTEPLDEPDGLDEIFLPADVGPWDSRAGKVANAITDDALHAWLGAICAKGAHVWLIADSCHAGTLIRGRGVEISRKVAPAALVPGAVLQEVRPRAATVEDLGRRPGLVVLHAAQPDEPTVEDRLPDARSPYHGLLTYTLVQTLKEARAPLTFWELTRRIYANYLALGRSSPLPLLDARDEEGNGYVLNSEKAPGSASYLLERETPARGIVHTGALDGLTVGSRLAVETVAEGPKGDDIARFVRVVEGGLSPLRARVEPCQSNGTPEPRDLPVSARCRVDFIDCGDLRLRVAVDRLVGAEVTAEQGSPTNLAEPERARLTALLHEASASEEREHRLFAPEDEVARADWLIRATTPGADTLVLVPGQGWAKASEAPLPSSFGPFSASAAELKDRLFRIARAQNLLKVATSPTEILRGPSDHEINLKVELVRLKDDHDRIGTVLPPDPNQTFRVGDFIGVRLENQGRAPVDLTLLWIDGDSRITAAFPDGPGVDNRLLPSTMGGTPLLKGYAITAEGLGREHLVIFAAAGRGQAERVDYTFLAERTFADAERGVRTRGGAEGAAATLDSPLSRLLQSAVFARGLSRGLKRIEARSYSIQNLTWRSLPRAITQPTGSKGF